MVNFSEAVEILRKKITRERLAEAFASSRVRLDRAISSIHYGEKNPSWRLPPPLGWRKILSKVATERANELLDLAQDLELNEGKGDDGELYIPGKHRHKRVSPSRRETAE